MDELIKNICLRRAIERNIEIIGEAMNRILKIDRNITITNSSKIVDARNYIIHGYDSLSVDILWSMVINHLPKFMLHIPIDIVNFRSSLRNTLKQNILKGAVYI